MQTFLRFPTTRLPLSGGALLLAVGLWLAPSLAWADADADADAEVVPDPGPAAVFAQLDEDRGWVLHKADAKGDVDVYRKPIEGLRVPAFKGVKEVDVDPNVLFEAIIDIERHVGLSSRIPLRESEVLKRDGDTIDFYQFLESPAWTFAKDRFWVNRARISRAIGGVAGHHKQTWEAIPTSAYRALRERVVAEHKNSVTPPVNYGSWEVIPQQNGKTQLVYRVVSEPGGSLPLKLQSFVTAGLLPDNVLQFEAEGARRMAKGANP